MFLLKDSSHKWRLPQIQNEFEFEFEFDLFEFEFILILRTEFYLNAMKGGYSKKTNAWKKTRQWK